MPSFLVLLTIVQPIQVYYYYLLNLVFFQCDLQFNCSFVMTPLFLRQVLILLLRQTVFICQFEKNFKKNLKKLKYARRSDHLDLDLDYLFRNY